MAYDFDAIRKAYPDAVTLDEGNGVFDKDGQSITLEQTKIDAARTTLNTEAAAIAYQGQRKAEYPSIEDQLDNIYHNGIDAWKATIKTIKNKYPKP